MNSYDQVQRLLALVPSLQVHPDADLAATASVFGVSARQLVADLKVLWYCGLPGGLPGDLIEVDMDALEEGRIRLSNADYLARPLRLGVDEVMSLVVALRALEEMADTGTASAVKSALAKLEAVVGGLGAAPVGVRLATGPDAVRDRLADALERGRAVRLTYHGASRGTTTSPFVDPARLATVDGYGYLVAWSRDREAWRTYRLDRIAEVHPADDPVGDHGPAPALASGGLDERPDAAAVTHDLAAEGRWITEYHPMVEVLPTDAGGVRARLLVADPAWLRRLLLRLGPAVRAVEPPDAARSASEAAREALAAYAELADPLSREPAASEHGSPDSDDPPARGDSRLG